MWACAAIAIFLLCVPSNNAAHAQGESAVPFILITSSVDGNGMAGISGTIPSEVATAPIANPAQLGLFSLKDLFSGAVYPSQINWLPEFNIKGLAYTTTGFSAGVNLQNLVSLPFPVSIGLGYSRIRLDLGRFMITNSSGPTPIGSFDAYETSDQFSVGLGFEYLVRIGIGFNTKRIVSRLSPTGTEMEAGTGDARVWASDFGAMVHAPLIDIASALADDRIEMLPGLEPLIDLSFGYVHGNEGGEVRYVDAAMADPLPRKALLGLALDMGLALRVNDVRWRLMSFTLAREAEDLLINRKNDGTFTYQTGMGDLKFFENVIEGKLNDKATVRKGWQVQVGEILFVRGGRVSMPGLRYSTSGLGIHLNGVFRLLDVLMPENPQPWVRYIADNFDLQLCTSSYGDTTSPIDGTTFTQLNIVVRQFPW